MKKRILIDESNIPSSIKIITRLKSFSELRTGIYSALNRLRILDFDIYYKNPNEFFLKSFLERNPDIKIFNNELIDATLTSENFESWKILSNLSKSIFEDLNLFKETNNWYKKIQLKLNKFSLVGKKKNLFIHRDAKIYPNVVFDTKNGAIIISENVTISPFSFIEGPCFIGKDSKIDNARITGGTIIGESCRIGGEVENSIFEDYSNKHHEGFVGHSHIGSWVNFGALSTTSDLKNNYGIIKIKFKEEEISTDTIKFGSIIGDYTKIAIGVMLNTGCTIDIASNLISDRVKGYIEPFYWLDNEKYKLDKFISDAKKIMLRRNIALTKSQEDLIISIYHGNS